MPFKDRPWQRLIVFFSRICNCNSNWPINGPKTPLVSMSPGSEAEARNGFPGGVSEHVHLGGRSRLCKKKYFLDLRVKAEIKRI